MSVAKTGRLLVVHQAVCAGGFGGVIVAEVAERMFGSLKCTPRVSILYEVPYSAANDAYLRHTRFVVACGLSSRSLSTGGSP